MKTIGVVANCRKERSVEVLERLVCASDKLGLGLVADADTVRIMPDGAGRPTVGDLACVDVILAIGGDGTMLRVAREYGNLGKPIMGVNIGKLGFLTSVDEKDLGRALDCLARDKGVHSVRTVAQCSVQRGGNRLATYRALNDAVIASAAGRITTLDVSIDGEQVNRYVCDGIIVSTPAGSTGHSLSAGGPILTPETRALVISFICPHTLSSRPLVVPESSVVAITVSSEGDCSLSVDGQVGQCLHTGDEVSVARDDRSVTFVYLPGHSYYGVLRQKLRWRGSSL